MKKILLTAITSLTCFAAFAQGKVSFQNDSLRLVYYDSFTVPYPPGIVSPLNMPPGVTLLADLYMGTASSSLYYYSSATFSDLAPGKWNTVSVQAVANPATGTPAIPSGTVYVQIQIRDSAFAAENLKTPLERPPGYWWGLSGEFTFTLGTSVTYPVLWGANGNWPAVPIFVETPEPSASVLSLAGFAALLLYRHRRQTMRSGESLN